MWVYLLDANIVIVFQRAGHLETLAKMADTVRMSMVEDVYGELTIPKLGKPKTAEMREAARILDSSRIEVHPILVSSSEDAIRTQLLARKNIGSGEAASVAFAMHRPEMLFVTDDAKAIEGKPKLYRELPGEAGRILGLHAFLKIVVEHKALSHSAAATIATAAKTASNIEPPLWWADWLTNLATAVVSSAVSTANVS